MFPVFLLIEEAAWMFKTGFGLSDDTLSKSERMLALTVVSSLYVGTDSTHAVCSVQGQKEYCLVHCCNVHLGRPRVCPSMCTLPSVILPTAFIDLAAFLCLLVSALRLLCQNKSGLKVALIHRSDCSTSKCSQEVRQLYHLLDFEGRAKCHPLASFLALEIKVTW